MRQDLTRNLFVRLYTPPMSSISIITRLARFGRAIIHTKPRQLVARLRRIVGMKWRMCRAEQVKARLAKGSAHIGVRDTLPMPLLPPRTHQLKTTEGGPAVTFLAQARCLDARFDWMPTDLEHSQHLWLFNLHYMEFLEGAGDLAFEEIVTDWIAKNPPFGKTHNMSWHPYVTSLRSVVWMQQYARRTGLSDGFRASMRESLVQQLRYLELDLELDLRGNHLLKNIKALLWGSAFFEGPEASHWQARGRQLLEEELEVQFLADGLHYERSPAYHAQVFVDILECLYVMPEGPLRSRVEAVIHQAAQALADTTHPDGLTSLFNDGGLHMTYPPQQCLDAYTAYTGRTVSPRPVFTLEEAGYYGLRTDTSFLLVDAGPIAPDYLPAHGHGDIFSFEWSVEGQRIIVDAGVYAYEAGPDRAYVRSTRAHNTVTLDGEDQCEFWGAFRVGRRAKVIVDHHMSQAQWFVLAAHHTGYVHLKGRPIHRRTFEAGLLEVNVDDQIEKGGGQLVESRLLCHPSCTVTLQEGGALLQQGPIKIALRTQSEIRLEQANWHPDFGERQTCTQIVMTYGTAPCTGRYTLKRVPLLN